MRQALCGLFLLILISLFPPSIRSEEPEIKQNFSETIEDNSFLIEEAYNQDPGVVQHIFNFQYFPTAPKDFYFTFTQEWPVVSIRHQLSYTLPFQFPEGSGGGINDILLNYRYQLFKEDDWAAVSPRLSLIFPTGSVAKGLGSGTVGVQINLPVSKRWSNHFITHFNLGGTFLPGAEMILPSGLKAKKTLTFCNLGVSLGWLATKHFNFLLETLGNFSSEIDNNGNTDRYFQLVINPLIRGSIDVGSLQIVPGIGVPIVQTKGNWEPSLFFYLSFEHPFMKTKS